MEFQKEKGGKASRADALQAKAANEAVEPPLAG